MSDSSVYVQDKEHGWLPASVISQNETEATVKVMNADSSSLMEERTVKLSDYDNGALPLQNVDASGNLLEMADMVDLPSLHEAAILYNLRARHQTNRPYTRVGDLIIAVNPFKWMEELYADKVRSEYIERLIWDTASAAGGDVKSGLDPHVYETSSLAYRGLAVDGQHQSILVSGESGAGKTETVKIVMSHLASVQNSEIGDKETESHHLVVQRVLDSHPLLEAFGNAKTVRNDNSSRFGKFIQMEFDVEDATTAAFRGKAVPCCLLAGSTCETYLLEKSRVVGHEPEERTYHIFYQLLAASDETKAQFWDGLVGKTNASFRYVGETDTLKIEGKTDGERLERTLKALELLDVTGDKLKMLMRAVCSVMQLGNIVFAEDPEDSDKSIITSNDELSTLSDLMGIPTEDLKKALTFRTVTAGRGETYTVPLKVGDARAACDAFAKEIYQQVFDWLVREINSATCAEVNYGNSNDVDEYGLIGLLDIFGFESFEVNRFEQLCINYTNEKLQQKYTLDIFRSVQEEYAFEGIALGEIAFTDNAEVLTLIEGRMGVISVLNEECVRPKGNDEAFVAKVKTVNKEVPSLLSEKLHKPTEFGIQHYAGNVTYDASNFIQKNTDTLPKDLVECACKSTNALIQVELKAAADARMEAAASSGRRATRTTSHTVAAKFKSQLSHLMHNVGKTHTRYIRCIKPNPEKVPIKMDMFSSAEQLRCAGVVAAVTISRVAFPNRLMHETVLERFECLSSVDVRQDVDEKKEEETEDGSGYRSAVESLLDDILKDLEIKGDGGAVTKAFECGKSRIYFRTGALEYLEAKRLKALGVFATAIERMARGFTARSLFWKLKDAAIQSQADARRTIARKSFLKAKAACLVLSCWIRCVFAKMELTRLQRESAAIKIQSRMRMAHSMAMYAQCRGAATTIQKIARGAIQRPKYRVALKEAEEEARVNTKLAALQKRLHEAEMKWITADKKRIEAEKRAAGLEEKGGVAAGDEGQAAVTNGAKPEGVGDAPPSAAQEKALIDESNAMLDYFKQEVFKLKSANYLLRTDLAAAKEENKQLHDRTLSAEASLKAVKQNVSSISQNNMKLAVTNTRQKETNAKLKQEMKKAKFKHVTELKKLKEERDRKEKIQEAEMKRLKKELEHLRNIVANNPNPSDYRQSRASFQSHPSIKQQKGGYSMSRSSSMENMSAISTSETSYSGEEWGHDGYHDRYTGLSSLATASWTRVEKKKRMRKSKSFKGPSRGPPGRFSGRRNPAPTGSRRNPKFTPHKKSPATSPNPTKSPLAAASPNNTPKSSLAAAAATKSRGQFKQKLPAPPLSASGSSLAKAAGSRTTPGRGKK